MLAVDDLIKGLAGTLISRQGPLKGGSFSRVVIDSREAQPGDLFVALRGERHDGHDFVQDAITRGAVGAIVGRPSEGLPEGVAIFQVSDTLLALQHLAAFWRAKHHTRVVGVSGSVGKTTCKELTAAVLGQRYRTLKSEGNLNTEIGLPLTLLGLGHDHEMAVLEMAMYARGDISLLCQIAQPQVGVITNIGPVHMERLGSLEAIADAKAELLEALPPKPQGVAILNGDDPQVVSLALRTSAKVILYGTSPQCQVRGSGLTSHGLEGISFYLTYGEASLPVATRIPGRHNLHNALAAAAVGLSAGMTLEAVAMALAQARPALRLQILNGPMGSTIIDDSYNASPVSMIAALDLLSEMPGRKLALLGDMRELGSAEEAGHRQVGQHAAGIAEALFLIGEKATLMADAARLAGHPNVQVLHSKEEAMALLQKELRRGDYLLVKASRALALETVVGALRL